MEVNNRIQAREMIKKDIFFKNPFSALSIGIICTLFTAGLAHATTYYSPFHAFAVNHATYIKYVSSGSNTFIVDGVLQHTWAELYVNGTYIPPSQESYWPLYVDPTFNRTTGSSDIVEIVVYNADNLSIWEKHKFIVDTIKPHNPDSYTSTPPANTWSNLGTVSVTWSGAYDNETGLDGYSVVWTQSPTTIPDTTKDQSGTSSSTNYADGYVFTNIYCHARAVDKASPPNWADGALHCGPFNIDREDPGTPTQQSPSNGGTVSTLRPTLTWSAASDGYGSGVAKYHLKVFQNWGVYWDIVDKDVMGTSYTLSESEALQWGKNYGWRVYAIDNVGNSGTYTGNWYFTTSAAWTVMVYLDGDNNLEQSAIGDFLEMAQVNNPNINIVVQFDRGSYSSDYGGWTTAKRFLVTQSMTPTAANAVQDIGEVNMGAMSTLRDFINWARSSYPANNYALILWNHGDGWRFMPEADSPFKGICSDDSGDELEISELDQALSEATGNGTNPIHVVNMDACLMAGLEVAYSLRNYAQFFSGSAELVPGDGSEYQDILSPDHLSAGTTPQVWCQYTVTAYQSRYDGWNNQQTYVACRLSEINNLSTRVSDLATLLINNIAAEWSNISDAWSSSRRYTDDATYANIYNSFVDLHDFCSNLRLRTINSTIANQCLLVMATVANDMEVSYWADAQYAGTTGSQRCFWIYFPPSTDELGWNNYNGGFLPFLSLAQQHWDEFLQTYFAKGSLQFKSAAYSVAENGGSVRIYVSRTGGFNGAASVNYSTTNGTATAGSDYTVMSGTLTWTNGDTSDKYFDVAIIDDISYEGNETFAANLSGATGANQGSPSSTTVTIVDNDFVLPTVSIVATDSSAGEPANNGYFTVSRTESTAASLRVYYGTSGSTATSGSDYAALPGYVDISSGQTSALISVVVIDDSIVESSETVQVTLSSDASYDIDPSHSNDTVTIADNDIPTGNLQVTLGPAGAVSAGAQWNVDGGEWQNSGDTVTDLSVGPRTVNYKAVTGWTAPPSEQVTINNGQTTSIIQNYTPQTGHLTISAAAGLNGTVEPNGVFDVNFGADVNFTAEPNEGYTVDRWYLDGNSVQQGNASYTLYNVQADHNVLVTFIEIPPMDLNNDGIVNFSDFAIFAFYWMDDTCSEPDWCEGSDSDYSGRVDLEDLMIFAEDWLWVEEEEDINLVGYWKFDEGSGQFAEDSSGHLNRGTLKNGTSWGDGILCFDGVDDWVEVNDSDTLDITNQITLSAWVYFDSNPTTWTKIIIKPYTIYDDPWELYCLDFGHKPGSSIYNIPRFELTDGVPAGNYGEAYDVNYTLPEGSWHQIVGTYDGSIAILYVNGQPVASSSVTLQIGANDMSLSIGGRLGTNDSFNGCIDDVRIYNRALTPGQISALYNNEKATHLP